MIRIPLKNRFFFRLLIAQIFLVSIPLVLTGIVLIRTSETAFREIVLSRNREFARRSADQLQMTLQRAREILRLNARNPAIYRMDRLTQEMVLNRLIQDVRLFKRLMIVDTTGALVSSTDFPPHLTGSIDTSLLQAARQGRAFYSRVRIGRDRLPYIQMAEPLARFNEVVGFLVADVDLKAMWELVDASVVGERGEAFVVDQEGFFIAHTDRRKVYLKQRLGDSQILQDILVGHGGQRVYRDRDGVEKIGAYAPLPEWQWGVVIQQPTSEAFRPGHLMRRQILLFVLIGLLLASGMAFVLSRWITRPLQGLMTGIQRFSTGHLDYRIPRMSRDELGQLAEEFNQMATRLQRFQDELKRRERADVLGKMASILSHEVRNPLNSMAINLQVVKRELEKNTPDEGKIRKFLDILGSEIRRIDDLVSNFLLAARPPKLQKRREDLIQILEEVIATHQLRAEQQGVQVERSYALQTLHLRVDRQKIKQVFLNLFLNALQAMEHGGRLTIKTGIVSPSYSEVSGVPSSCARIEFEDTGVGIAPSDLPRIFDIYFSTKKDGTGLGLPIARQIVEEHGGKIAVQSQVNRGTTVAVFLPLDEGG